MYNRSTFTTNTRKSSAPTGISPYQSIDDQFLEAAKYNLYNKVIELAEMGANLNYMDTFGNDAIHYAVAHKNNVLVRFLLENDAEVNTVNAYGETPLMIAINNNDIPNIKDLYNMGGWVNTIPQVTPLIYVLTSNLPNKYNIASVLLEIIEDSNEIMSNGKSAVQYLTSISKHREAEFLRNRGGF